MSESAALTHVSIAENEVWENPGVAADTKLRPIAKAAVIGAGTMGGGISMSLANAGIPVTLIDVDAAGLERGLGRIRDNYAISVSKGRIDQAAMDQRMALLRPTTRYRGDRRCRYYH